jgi:hypothetical protein
MNSATRRAFLLSPILLLAGTCGALLAAPQAKAPGSLSGIVIGPDDKPVAHAVVAYQSSAGHGAHVIRANAKGRFHIAKLRADNYDIRASSKGIFSEWEKNVTVHSGRETNIILRLIYSRRPLRPASPKP